MNYVENDSEKAQNVGISCVDKSVDSVDYRCRKLIILQDMNTKILLII